MFFQYKIKLKYVILRSELRIFRSLCHLESNLFKKMEKYRMKFEATIHPFNKSSSVEFQLAQKSGNPFAGAVMFAIPRGRAHSALNDPAHRQR